MDNVETETTEEVVENVDNANEVEELEPAGENKQTEDKEVENKEEDIDFWKSEAEKWKGNSRKNEAASKTNFSRIKELETEVEQFKNSVSELTNLKEQNAGLLRKSVALEYGIPAELANRLVGDNEEDLKKDAELMKESFGSVKKTAKPVSLQGSDNENYNPGVISSGKQYEQQFRK